MSKNEKAPKTFREFRTLVGEALRTAGAPAQIVEATLWLDHEGGDVVGTLWRTYRNVEEDLKSGEDWLWIIDHGMADLATDLLFESMQSEYIRISNAFQKALRAQI